MDSRKIFIGLTLFSIISVVGISFLAGDRSQGNKLDGFTKCLKEKKALFYGAFWCPHCQNQKKLFGSSEKYLPYIECSTPDGKGQIEVCKNKNIAGYPTWEFADGTIQTGELSLAELSRKTNCQLPN